MGCGSASAYAAWVGGVAIDVDGFALNLKTHGVAFSSTTNISLQGGNGTILSATNTSNSGSATATDSATNSMAGHAASYNTSVDAAKSAAQLAIITAQANQLYQQFQDHADAKAAANSTSGTALGQYQSDIAEADRNAPMHIAMPILPTRPQTLPLTPP